MIPKIIWQIWVGNYIPTWVMNSRAAFIRFNPDYKFRFVHIKDFIFNKDRSMFTEVSWNPNYTENNFNLNKSLRGLNYNLLDKKSLIHWKYNQDVRDLNITNYKVILSDLLRFQLLYDYGGIYVDTDCMPIKCFDYKLINRTQFFASSYYGGLKIVRDSFFMGSIPGRWMDLSYWRILLLGDMFLPVSYKIKNSIQYNKFFSGELNAYNVMEIGPYTKHGYIDHYFRRSWKLRENS